MALAIKIENLSKQYRLGVVGTNTLGDDFKRFIARVTGKEDPTILLGEENIRERKGEGDYVWALKDINLEIREGEVVGIIGKNGAGKSTLLKILSRVTGPTTGTVKARGRIASLLEVGTGFHPELTGRENIFLNGAVLGMTKKEINRKLDEIIEFAGVERYVDTPVKRYSSGMKVRLGFAVAAHLEPEILVVDEVLAVGDAEFQKKAIGKMQSVSQGEGRTVLFVSHNMNSILNLCSRSVLLENGRITATGDSEEVVNKYIQGTSSLSTRYENSSILNHNINLLSVLVIDENLQEIKHPFIHEKIGLKVSFEVLEKTYGPVPVFQVKHINDQIIFTSFDWRYSKDYLNPGIYESTMWVPPNIFNQDKYKVITAMRSGRGQIDLNYKLETNVIETKEDFSNTEGNVLKQVKGVVKPKVIWN